MQFRWHIMKNMVLHRRQSMSKKELEKLIQDVEKKMKKAAAELNFEAAAQLRDQMVELKKMLQKIDS